MSSSESASESAASTELLPAPGGPVMTTASIVGLSLAEGRSPCFRARGDLRRLCALERRQHPRIGRQAAQPLRRREQPALEAEVAALGRPGLDVLAVDADGRRAQKPLALGRLGVLDANELDARIRAAQLQQFAQVRKQRLVVRAAIKVKDLDLHELDGTPSTHGATWAWPPSSSATSVSTRRAMSSHVAPTSST